MGRARFPCRVVSLGFGQEKRNSSGIFIILEVLRIKRTQPIQVEHYYES